MKKVRIPFFGILISLMLVGSAFAVDITGISTWTQSMGVGGGGPGRGDVLLGPLYDVRSLVNTATSENTAGGRASTQQTYITIVNTDDFNGYICRLRFREWKRSREVFDIDIPLSRSDVFVAEVSLGANGVPVIYSPDRYVSSVTATHFNTAPWPAAGFQFSNFDLESPLNGTPMPDAAKPRLLYGYIEFIGEERVAAEWDATYRFARLAAGLNRDALNVLIGNVYLIRPEVAISHQYNFTALTNFAIDANGIWQPPQNQRPTLLQDVQGYGTNPGVGGFDQLESVLSKRWIYFTYVNGIDAASNTPMNTSVVVTFPTKLFHYTKTTPFPRIQVPPWFPPFTGTHETPEDAVTGGELIDYAIFNRSEKRLDRPDLPPISPPPPPGARPRLPWEVNVIGLYPVDPPVVGFRDNVGISTASPLDVFLSGWGWLDLSPLLFASSETREAPQGEGGRIGIFDNIGRVGAPWLAATVPAYNFGGFNFFGNPFNVYYGLPAIGIIMTEFYNDSVYGYYGNTVPWQYQVEWYNLP